MVSVNDKFTYPILYTPARRVINVIYLSDISKMLHYMKFLVNTSSSELDKGSLIFSIDVDVGSEKVGEKNRGIYDSLINDEYTEKDVGKIEEKIVPLLIQLFDEYEVPVTFALRGQVTEIDNSIIDLLLNSKVNHDIGAHGYYHTPYSHLSEDEANKEFELISKGMGKYGIKPKSFIFPKNEVAHLSLLEKWGYTCFRGPGNWIKDGMFVKRYGNVFDIHPGLYLGKCHNPRLFDNLINLAITYVAPFHVWFHPRDLGDSEKAANKRIKKVFHPLLEYAKEKQEEGVLSFDTMYSLVDKISC